MQTKKTTQRKSAPGRSAATKSSRETLADIFEDLLKDTYWAEKHLVKALPKMAKAAHTTDLREAFESHLEETKSQVSKVEKCFEIMGIKAQAKKCEAMEGLVKEGAEAIEDHAKGNPRDAALIAAAQKVEHYEISAYGTLRTMANVLGREECAELLQEIGEEESKADEKLTELSRKINKQAAFLDEEEDE